MANINDIVFMKPSVDDTQADRMRIPAAANAMGKVVHNMEQAMDEDEGDELEFIAAAHALIIVDAALTAMEEDDASDLHEQQAAASSSKQQQAAASSTAAAAAALQLLEADAVADSQYQAAPCSKTRCFLTSLHTPSVRITPWAVGDF
jgi:phosphoenolpyruvate-protein kinase (PTS system EI component)